MQYAEFAWYFSNKYYLLVRKDAGIHRLPISSTTTSFSSA